MAKFTIEVDVDWIDERDDLDAILQNEIVSKISNKIINQSLSNVQAKVDETITARVEQAIDEKLNTLLEDFFTRPRTLTDRWGDKTREEVSVMELLKERCDNFIDGYVDKDGKTVSSSGYGNQTKRVDYTIQKQIDHKLNAAIKTAADEVKQGIQKYVKETITGHIGENIVQALGLESIIAKAGGK